MPLRELFCVFLFRAGADILRAEIPFQMALDGPYTIDDLIAMTGGRSKPAVKRLEWFERLTVSRARKPKGVSRLIGIDPGTRFVGWGVLDCDAGTRTLRLVDCGCIAPGTKLGLQDRLRGIFEELEKILARTRRILRRWKKRSPA